MDKTETKKQLVKNHLLKGGSISGRAALRVFGLYRLSSVIHRLRDEGMDIQTTMVESPTGDKYAIYRLNQKPNTNEKRQRTNRQRQN